MSVNMPCSIHAHPAPPRHGACVSEWNIGAQCVDGTTTHFYEGDL